MPINKPHDCPYNRAVECYATIGNNFCRYRCGWNPVVEKKRKGVLRMLARMGVLRKEMFGNV